MKTDTETIIADLRHMADKNWLSTLLTQAADRLEHLKKIVDEVRDTFYGQSLQVANWHKNGELEPMDAFFESNNWIDK